LGAAGQVEAAVNPRGHAATLSWDDYDRTGVLDPLGHRITCTYNAAGQLETETNEQGHTISLTYDAVGHGDCTKSHLPARSSAR
jgi:YD repeat-containing protein